MFMKKRAALRGVLAVLLALVFLGAGTVLAAPEAADADSAAEAAPETGDSVLNTAGRAGAVVDIPEGTTAITNGQFRDNRDLTLVRIPNSVKTIGDNAFRNCTNLTQIIIPDSVTTIGEGAFAYSGISKADIGNGVTNIGDEAFYRCEKLRTLTLGSRVNIIGSQAFWGCTSLLQVELPDSVTQIKGSDRASDYSYDNSDYDSNDNSYSANLGAFGNCTSLQRVTIGSGLTALEGHTFRGCTDLRQVTFGPNLRTIGPMAFRNTRSLVKADLPDSLVEIGAKAFKQSGITELTAGSGLTQIGEYAFQNCKNLAAVQFGENLRLLGAGAFSGCASLEEAPLPESIARLEGNGTLEGGVFSGCSSLTEVITGDALLSIGDAAFYNCTSLQSAVIGPRAQSVGASAFRSCSSLAELTIPDSVQSLGANLARASGISKVSIGSGAQSVPECAFQDCERLTDVTIGKNVTDIGAGAFSGCQSLREIVIPDKVDIIGGQARTGAFENCISLETVTLGVKSFPADNTFRNCPALRTIRYPGTQAEWEALGFPLPAGATLVLFTPQPSASTDPTPTTDPGTEPKPSTAPSPSAAPSSSAAPSTDPSPGISLPASAVQLSGCDFVYTGAQVPLNINVNDSRISSLSGQLVCSGFREAAVPVRAVRNGNDWTGTSYHLDVTAAVGQYVSCRLTDLEAVVEGQTVPLADRYYNSIPVRQFNRPADYLTIAGPPSVRSGETILLTIAGRGEGLDGSVQTQGLEFVSVSSSMASSNMVFLLPDYGIPSVTYTYRVSAVPGQTVSFQVRNVHIAADGMVLSAPDMSWSGSVPAGPQAVPAPSIPAVSGYQGGLLNGRVYYTRTSSASMLFYQGRSNGSMGRVSAPYVTDKNGIRYYPINDGGTVLYPRLENGTLTAYCVYRNNLQVPVLSAGTVNATGSSVLQSFALNGKTYYARTSGASMLFYQRRSNGSFGRVSAPYVTDRNGTRFYPVNCGGTILYPKLTGGLIASYCSDSLAGDIPALAVL